MPTVTFVEREMTAAEYAQIQAGFDSYSLEQGSVLETQERHTVVVLDGDQFVGAASGLATHAGGVYTLWFYVTDLFIAPTYRGRGLGAAVLRKLEARVAGLGVQQIWLWTAEFEASGFYRKQGYSIVCELDHWYVSGHSRFGLRNWAHDARPLRVRIGDGAASTTANDYGADLPTGYRRPWCAPAGQPTLTIPHGAGHR